VERASEKKGSRKKSPRTQDSLKLLKKFRLEKNGNGKQKTKKEILARIGSRKDSGGRFLATFLGVGVQDERETKKGTRNTDPGHLQERGEGGCKPLLLKRNS